MFVGRGRMSRTIERKQWRSSKGCWKKGARGHYLQGRLQLKDENRARLVKQPDSRVV